MQYVTSWKKKLQSRKLSMKLETNIKAYATPTPWRDREGRLEGEQLVQHCAEFPEAIKISES